MAYQQQQDRERPKTVSLAPLSPEELAECKSLTEAFTESEITLISEQFPTAPEDTAYRDFKIFLYKCSAKSLNPLLDEIHAEYKSDKNSPSGVKMICVAHAEGVQKVAASTGQLDGVEQVPGSDDRGLYVDTTVWKKGCAHPFRFRAYHSEFAGNAPIWGKMTYNMTAKCGRMGCLKIAFAAELGGLLIEEEVPLVDSMARAEERAAEPDLKIGERRTEEKKSEPVISPSPQPTSPAPTPAPTPPQPKPQPEQQPAEDPRKLYQKKAGVLMDQYKLTLANLQSFFFGWFGIETKDKLPKDPQEYFTAMDALSDALKAGGDAQAVIADGKGVGSRMRQMENSNDPAAHYVHIKAKYGWDDTTCAIAGRVCSLWGADSIERSGLAREPIGKIQAWLSLAEHSEAAFGIVEHAAKSGMPISQYLMEVTRRIGKAFDKATSEEIHKALMEVLAA